MNYKRMAILQVAAMGSNAIFQPANALLLCEPWSYASSDWVQSASSGWGNTHAWTVSSVYIPADGFYKVDMTLEVGDNDNDWWHTKSTTKYVWLPTEYWLYYTGSVKQSSGNSCGDYDARMSLSLRKVQAPFFITKLSNVVLSTVAEGGVHQEMLYGMPVTTGLCNGIMCIGTDCDIDRARGYMTITPVPSTAFTDVPMWTEAEVRDAIK